MKKQFVDLFDQEKYGFNFFAVIALFLAGIIGMILSIVRYKIIYPDFPSIFGIKYIGTTVLTNLVFAFVFIWLCHIIKKDIFLPFATGLVQVILGTLYRITGLYGGQFLDFEAMLIDFFWISFLAGGLILFFRIMGFKPVAFLFGYITGGVFIQLFAHVIFSTPFSMFWKILLFEIVDALIAGSLFYFGMAFHFKEHGIQIEREGVIVSPAASPIAPEGLPGTLPAEFIAAGKFRKVAVRPLTGRGRYRGQGSMHADEQGIKLFGRHVFSLGARWGIAIAIFFGFLIFTMAMTGGQAYFAPGLIPLYFLMEYGILKRENIFIPYSAFKGYAADPKGNLIAVSFEGSSWCTPAVLRTENWREMLRALREKVPQLDKNPGIAAD